MDGIYVAIAICELTLRSALFSFCLQHNLLDDESLNDRMRGGTRYDVSENEHCDMHIVGICNVFLSLRISLR